MSKWITLVNSVSPFSSLRESGIKWFNLLIDFSDFCLRDGPTLCVVGFYHSLN